MRNLLCSTIPNFLFNKASAMAHASNAHKNAQVQTYVNIILKFGNM